MICVVPRVLSFEHISHTFRFLSEAPKFYLCLVRVFENCFLFKKIADQGNKENLFDSFYFFIMKNRENTENKFSKKKKQFSEHNKIIFFKFLILLSRNNFQK